MYLKYFSALVLFLTFSATSAQMPDTFGKLTNSEKQLTSYDKDSTAHAVVLHERGDNYYKLIDRRVRLVKEYHTKIKILDEKGFGYGTIKIPLYHHNNLAEKVTKIRAVTHNDGAQYNVLPKEIFTEDLSDRWQQKKFTFPKMQKGSILEYSYTIITPYDYNFKGWSFQSSIPKLYSEFNAKIPGNYVFNRSLTGALVLDINDAKVQKECFHIDGFAKAADCEVLKYAMKDIPAFKAENEYMLSENNYISRLEFELSQLNRFDGTTEKFTKSWKDVDREFRTDKDIGRQMNKKGFFEKNVPESLLTDGDALTKAKNIYEFVRDHYTWTGKNGSIFGTVRVKEAFDEKKGSVAEINMSLINLLKAADIKTNLVLLSTRDEALPKKIHPVISDFNYFIAKAEINGEDYLLDATDKFNPFGMLPFKALNHYGRVMDFKKESYWYDIRPEMKNRYQIRANLTFNVQEQKAEGIFDVTAMGYDAVYINKVLKQSTEEEYLDDMEEDINGEFQITGHELIKERSNEKKTSERFTFMIEDILKGDVVYLNPFLITFFDENPFQMEERNYPIDFGYPRNYKYSINIEIPEGYEVQELPEKQAVQVGDELVFLQFFHQQNLNQIALVFELSMKNTHFTAEAYTPLKNLFKHVTDIQKNSLVVFKKIGGSK